MSMKCFGEMEPTKEVNKTGTSTTSPPQWVQSAGQDNYNLARDILGKGYEGYGGQRVAEISPWEQTAGDMIYNKAVGGNPWEGFAGNAFQTYGSAPGYNFDFNTIIDQNGPLGSIQSYMDPYLEMVLGPQLREIQKQGQQQRLGINANATNAGAYGDARHGVVESEQRKNEAELSNDTVGKAWSNAFGSAMGLRGQDAARQFSTQQAQAAEDRAKLERMRASGIDLTNLDKYGVSRDLGLAGAMGQAGQTQRNIHQAKLDAGFEDYLRRTGFDQNTISWLAQILKGTPVASTTNTTGTEVTQQPNNSGWQLLGTLAGTAANALKFI